MRLIDADALLASEWDLCDAVEAIKNAPTVDAVPVVRCKDCKWQEPHYCEGIVKCGRFKSGKKQLWMRDNDFCSCGERKDDDNANV